MEKDDILGELDRLAKLRPSGILEANAGERLKELVSCVHDVDPYIAYVKKLLLSPDASEVSAGLFAAATISDVGDVRPIGDAIVKVGAEQSDGVEWLVAEALWGLIRWLDAETDRMLFERRILPILGKVIRVSNCAEVVVYTIEDSLDKGWRADVILPELLELLPKAISQGEIECSQGKLKDFDVPPSVELAVRILGILQAEVNLAQLFPRELVNYKDCLITRCIRPKLRKL